MNSDHTNNKPNSQQPQHRSKKPSRVDWRDDLMASRDLNQPDKDGYALFIGWFERWRLGASFLPDKDTANRFWREKVLTKTRLDWQLDQWFAAMKWYLRWLTLCEEKGVEARSVPERMRAAVRNVGSRRGLGDRTIDSYGSWVIRFGQWAGTAKRAMDPAVGRDFLSHQVEVKGVSESIDGGLNFESRILNREC